MCKYECKHCGNTEISNFRSTSDCGLCMYKGEKYFYFEHLCKCSYPMYVIADSSFNKRLQVSEGEFAIIKGRVNKEVKYEEN